MPIPKIIFQTWKTKTLPAKIQDSIDAMMALTLGNVNYVTAVALRCIGGDNICYVLQTSLSHMIL